MVTAMFMQHPVSALVIIVTVMFMEHPVYLQLVIIVTVPPANGATPSSEGSQ